jgi:MOSC domain-containing protein YiiM
MNTVRSVHRSSIHGFSKESTISITLLAGLGVEGDAHCGELVKHRSRVAADPSQPNLRQVHLMMGETLDDENVPDGELGENITTYGIDLHALPTGTLMSIGDSVIELTGLRNPCAQINTYRDGLLSAFRSENSDGEIVRRAGIMAIVVNGGTIRAGDEIRITTPHGKSEPLRPV